MCKSTPIFFLIFFDFVCNYFSIFASTKEINNFKQKQYMKKKWMRTLVGGLSVSAALFVFQACYGSPQDFELDTFVNGKVVSSADGQPISGIKIEVTGTTQHQYTDDKGRFGMYIPR